MDYLITKEAKGLYKALLSLETLGECKRFLGDLLTPAEIKEFSNRWKVAQMLDKKISYEEIEQATGMSTTTIARISKWLSGTKGNLEGYQLVLKKMRNKNKQQRNVHHLSRI